MITIFLVGFAVIVFAGSLKQSWHMGLLAVNGALLIGVLFMDLQPSQVFALFPLNLFFTLLGLSLFFSLLTDVGLVEVLTSSILKWVRGSALLIPLLLYLVVSLLSALGVGNIAATAMVAPFAMRTAQKIGLSQFLMTLIIVGAANSAVFSPVSVGASIVRNFMETRGGTFFAGQESTLIWQLFFLCLFTYTFVVFAAFHILGGTAWVRSHTKQKIQNDHKGATFEPRAHFVPLLLLVLFIVSVLAFSSSYVRLFAPTLGQLVANLGAVTLFFSMLMMIFAKCNTRRAIAKMPWDTLFLITSMSLFIELMMKANVLTHLASQMTAFATEQTVGFWLGFGSSFLSAFSSSTAVVLPLFLNLTTQVHEAFPGVSPLALLVNIGIPTHLVDMSPLSTLGALCIASTPDAEERPILFKKLLLFGFIMVPVGSVAVGLLSSFF